MPILRAIPVVIVILCAVSASAQGPFLVRDVNSTHAWTDSSDPNSFVELNGKVVFFGETQLKGREPWVFSNGVATMLRDILPGSNGGALRESAFFDLGNGVALFIASDWPGRTQLWRTDGTPDGTVMVEDIRPTGNADVWISTVIDGKAYLRANDGVNGREPWVSDGTAEGTFMLANLDGTSASSSSVSFVSVGTRIFMFANSTLWVVDGSVSPVAVSFPGGAGSPVAIGNTVYFTSSPTDTGRELWKTDGTIAGTQLVYEIRPGSQSAFSNSHSLIAMGTNVVFLATADGVSWDLWRSDGTGAGTRVVKSAISAMSTSSPYMSVAGNLTFFVADGRTWRTDGTGDGTFILFNEGLYNFGTAFGRTICLRSVDTTREFWTTDGTVAGTARFLQQTIAVRLYYGTPYSVAGGKLYFGSSTMLNGLEPWVSEDGTDAGTHMLANAAYEGPPSSDPVDLKAGGGFLYFRAHAGGAPTELWRTDGTAAGTLQLTSLGGGLNSPWLSQFSPVGGHLWFRHSYFDLWRTDGSVAGTQRWSPPEKVESLWPTSTLLYFSSGDKLWRSDGTESGTTPVTNAVLSRDGVRGPAVELAGRTYLSGSSGDPGLFITQGTEESTRRILAFAYGELDSSRYFPAAGALYFMRTQSATGAELWRSDGTFDGTKLVKDIAPGTASSGPQAFAAAGPYLFFTADDGTHGRELWRTDGTEAGTVLLKDIVEGAGSAQVGNVTAVGNVVYFTAVDATSGEELWRSDGSPQGTLRVADLNPGAASSAPRWLTAADNTLFFAASDGLRGIELWRTTGLDTVEIVADLASGQASSTPAEMTRSGSLLYFAATTDSGRELWALPLAASSLSIADVRVTEGAAGTTRNARFTVTRVGSTASTASAAFSVSSGDATAGADYVQASGSVSFAAGEATAFIDVTVNGDSDIENNEVFYVSLGSATNAAIHRGTAVAIIEDDDHRADLSIEWVTASWSPESRRVLLITNRGPSAASDVRLRYRESPSRLTVRLEGSWPCYDLQLAPCTLPPIPAGTAMYLNVTVDGIYEGTPNFSQPNTGQTIHVTVTAAEADTNVADNTLWRMISRNATLVVPPFLVAGNTAAASVHSEYLRSYYRNATVQSSSANVVPSPSTVVIPADQRSGPFSLIAGNDTGVVTLSVRAPEGRDTALRLAVVAPGQEGKLDVAFYAPSRSINYGETAELSVEVAARRYDDVLPSGTLELLDFATGAVIEQQVLVNGAATFSRSGLAPGYHQFKLRYGGDQIFNPLTAGDVRVSVANWATETRVHAPVVICGNATITVRVRNTSTSSSPTGSVVLRLATNGSPIAVIATVPLQPGTAAGEALATYTHTFGTSGNSISAEYVPSGTFTASSGSINAWITTCTISGLSATGTSSQTVAITWTANGAHHYDVLRMSNRTSYSLVGSTSGTTLTHSGVSPNVLHVYWVCAMSESNVILGCSQADLATTTMFADDPLVPQTVIKRTHILQLQSSFDYSFNIVFFGMPAFTPVPTSATVRAVHVNELRQAVNAYRGAIGLPLVNFSDVIAPGTTVRALHIQELRDALK